jgi:hypothetical protein
VCGPSWGDVLAENQGRIDGRNIVGKNDTMRVKKGKKCILFLSQIEMQSSIETIAICIYTFFKKRKFLAPRLFRNAVRVQRNAFDIDKFEVYPRCRNGNIMKSAVG